MSEDDAKEWDPRGLIREAYRIEGITKADCRSIFLDWALGINDSHDPVTAIPPLLAHYADEPADHPMTEVLREGLDQASRPRRRGGADGRRR